ncbi:hypothetical protein LPJ78_001763 [Coemansia sp. RSA 989]|nr:hypothetical protein LPJ78_001763 [Coemansia sp. RSA 989]KAJ1873850.1 hypothetical protein LPJ55_001984 [Coemansia sp. RSA 990]
MLNPVQELDADSPICKPLPPYEDIIKASSGSPNDMLILNVSQNEVVYQHYIIVHGQVLEAKGKDDKIVVHHPKLPSLEYPAIDGYFKAVVELAYGVNELTFEYKQGATVVSQSTLTISRGKFTDKPPLKLAILLAKDSPETFDAPPGAQGPGINDLDAAVKKMRCCAYLWQAYMAEMMYRNGCGRRTFRLEEEPDSDAQDESTQQPRAKVHIIRSQTSLAEMRDKRNAQQWRPSKEEKGEHDPGFLKRNLMESIDNFEGLSNQDNIACLLMDSHWDPEQDLIVGHTALASYQKYNSNFALGQASATLDMITNSQISERLFGMTSEQVKNVDRAIHDASVPVVQAASQVVRNMRPAIDEFMAATHKVADETVKAVHQALTPDTRAKIRTSVMNAVKTTMDNYV